MAVGMRLNLVNPWLQKHRIITLGQLSSYANLHLESEPPKNVEFIQKANYKRQKCTNGTQKRAEFYIKSGGKGKKIETSFYTILHSS